MTTSTASVTLPPAAVARFPLGPLLLLSLGVFVTVTAESLPAGLMPEMAAELGVDPLRIGLLVSVWAIVVIGTSIPLARAPAVSTAASSSAVSLAVFALANVAHGVLAELRVRVRHAGGRRHRARRVLGDRDRVRVVDAVAARSSGAAWRSSPAAAPPPPCWASRSRPRWRS